MADAALMHGLLAEFATPQEILAAVRQARAAGYTRLEAYTPYPGDGLAEEQLIEQIR